MTDQLEQRLRAADPMSATVPVDDARSERARTLVERTMAETLIPVDPSPSSRPRWLLVAAAAAVVAVVGVGVAISGGDDGEDPTPLALTVPTEDMMAMCIEVTPDSLRDASQVAFEGTVTELDGQTATMAVDRWFAGEEAEVVTVTGATENETALLGGVVLESGGQYLISAGDGEVRSCGLSGPVSPELEALYEAAFSG